MAAGIFATDISLQLCKAQCAVGPMVPFCWSKQALLPKMLNSSRRLGVLRVE
jgi:hypothetical protein